MLVLGTLVTGIPVEMFWENGEVRFETNGKVLVATCFVAVVICWLRFVIKVETTDVKVAGYVDIVVATFKRSSKRAFKLKFELKSIVF